MSQPNALGLILELPEATPARPWPALGDDLPKVIDGQPVEYRWKELIRDGQYTHPVYGWTLAVDGARRQKWAQNYERMAANGVKVFLPAVHREEFSATDNLGYLKAVKNDGASLWGLAQLIGDDAKRAAARNDVSIYLQPQAKDGRGNVYDEAITHVAVCPDPVTPALEGWQALAASASGGHAGGALVFRFAASAPAPPKTTQPPVKDEPMTPEEVQAVKEITGDSTVTAETAGGRLIAFARTAKTSYGLSVSSSHDGKFTLASQAVIDLNTKLAAAESAKALALSGSAPALPDDLAEQYAAAYETTIDALATGGNVLPACATKIKALLRTEGKPNGMAFSKAAGRAKPLLGEVLDALKENKALNVSGKPITGANVQANTGTGESAKPGSEAGRDLTKEMIEMAGGGGTPAK